MVLTFIPLADFALFCFTFSPRHQATESLTDGATSVAMSSVCGCGRYVIPAGKLISRKFNPSVAPAVRHRNRRSDQQLGLCCKRQFRVLCAASTVERPVQVTDTPLEVQQNKSAFRAFLDFKALKADLDKHVQNCKNRNSPADPQKVAQLYDQYCEAQQRVDKVREDRNGNAKAMKVPIQRCCPDVVNEPKF